MKFTRVAQRYAIAMYESARELNELEQVIIDARAINHALDSSRELLLFFKSPIVSEERKEKTIAEIFQDKINEFTLRMLLFLVRQRREDILKEILNAFFIIQRKREGIQLASVQSAIELTDSEKSKLYSVLRDMTKKQIELGFTLNPSIRGGVIVRLDDTVYDGSITNQLRQLRKRFAEGIAS